MKRSEATEAPQTGWSLTSSISRMRFERVCLSDHPVRAVFGTGLFSYGAATPPHEEGNLPVLRFFVQSPRRGICQDLPRKKSAMSSSLARANHCCDIRA